MHADYQALNANVMQLHSFCSAFGIQRKGKYIYTYILTNVRLYVLGRKLRFAPHTHIPQVNIGGGWMVAGDTAYRKNALP